jgi:hypothetical protein
VVAQKEQIPNDWSSLEASEALEKVEDLAQ